MQGQALEHALGHKRKGNREQKGKAWWITHFMSGVNVRAIRVMVRRC